MPEENVVSKMSDPKQKRESIKHVLALVIILGLIVVPAIGIVYLLFPSSAQLNPSLSGFDILHDCTTDLTASVELSLFENTGDVQVIVSINDWDKIRDNCNSINIYFPGNTSNHVFLRKLDSLSTGSIGPDTYESLRIPISDDVEISHDSVFFQDIIRIKPKDAINFTGAIEFSWLSGLKKVDFETLRLLLPFQALVTDRGTGLKSAKAFEVWLASLSGYDLTSETPQASNFHLIGDQAFYYFKFEAGETALSLIFSNDNLAHIKNYLLLLFAALLGVGLTLVFERIVAQLEARRV